MILLHHHIMLDQQTTSDKHTSSTTQGGSGQCVDLAKDQGLWFLTGKGQHETKIHGGEYSIATLVYAQLTAGSLPGPTVSSQTQYSQVSEHISREGSSLREVTFCLWLHWQNDRVVAEEETWDEHSPFPSFLPQPRQKSKMMAARLDTEIHLIGPQIGGDFQSYGATLSLGESQET